MGRTHIPDPVKFFWEKGEMDFLVAIFRIHAEDRHVDGWRLMAQKGRNRAWIRYVVRLENEKMKSDLSCHETQKLT